MVLLTKHHHLPLFLVYKHKITVFTTNHSHEGLKSTHSVIQYPFFSVIQGELQEAYFQEESTSTSLTKEQFLANNITSSDGPLQLITVNIGSAPGNDGLFQ